MAKKTPITTPKGELCYLFITKGRDNSERQDGSKWERSATFRCHKDSEEHKYLSGIINTAWEEYKASNSAIKKATEPKSLGYKPEKNKDTGEDTGYILYNFKTNKFLKDGTETVLPIYNIKGEKIKVPADTMFGNGTIGVLFGSIAGYEYKGTFGMSIYLSGVQISKFKEYEHNHETQDYSSDSDNDEDFLGFEDNTPTETDKPDI